MLWIFLLYCTVVQELYVPYSHDDSALQVGPDMTAIISSKGKQKDESFFKYPTFGFKNYSHANTVHLGHHVHHRSNLD